MRYIIISILLMLMLSACSNKVGIPKDKMTNVIFDMHVADALRQRTLNMQYSLTDSMAIYGPIFSKYGYTIDEFNSAMNYYVNKPEVLKEIYNEVIARLKNMREEYTALSIEERKNENLWNGADSLFVDSDSVYTKFDFSIPVAYRGSYNFSADIRFHEGDSTYNPRMVAWFTTSEKPDTVVGKKEIELKKQELFKCTLQLYLQDTTMNQLKGYFVDYDSINTKGKQHIEIKNIYVGYTEGDGVDSLLSVSQKDSLSRQKEKPKEEEEEGWQIKMMKVKKERQQP